MRKSIEDFDNYKFSNSEWKKIIYETLSKLGESAWEAFDQVVSEKVTITNERSQTIRPLCDLKGKVAGFRERHIAFQIQYDGVKYRGFADQNHDKETVENYIFEALMRLKLISSPQSCQYSRCGRTDKGVSALGQVVALKIRSSIPTSIPDDKIPLHPCDSFYCEIEGKSKKIQEMDYCTMLNNHLPSEIRVIGWCPVSENFSARFSASFRTYRYFFLKKNLDLEAMKEGAKLLIGSHDFRNMCKLDVSNVTNFVREVFDARISIYQENPFDSSLTIYFFEIHGVAFLWHMVRSIMAVLFLIGERVELPTIVSELLDISQYPSKPSYEMADDLPLVLHHCGYDNLTFHYEPRNLWFLTKHFMEIRNRHLIQAAQYQNALDYLYGMPVRHEDMKLYISHLYEKSTTEKGKGGQKRKFTELENEEQGGIESKNSMVSWSNGLKLIFDQTSLSPSMNAGRYISLEQRKREESYEERIQKLDGLKKERLERHLNLSFEKSDSTPIFFESMRREGTLRR